MEIATKMTSAIDNDSAESKGSRTLTGTVAWGDDGMLIGPGDMYAQAKQTIRNIEKLLLKLMGEDIELRTTLAEEPLRSASLASIYPSRARRPIRFTTAGFSSNFSAPCAAANRLPDSATANVPFRTATLETVCSNLTLPPVSAS